MLRFSKTSILSKQALSKTAALVATVAVLSGCVEAFPSPQPLLSDLERQEALAAPVPDGKATLYFAFISSGGELHHVRVDGNLIVRADYGVVRLDLLPGVYDISTGYSGYNNVNQDYAPVKIRLEAGQTYYRGISWQYQGNRIISEFPDYYNIGDLSGYPMLKSATDPAKLIPAAYRANYDGCISKSQLDACRSLQAEAIYPHLSAADKAMAEGIVGAEQRRIAEAQALENSLPPSARRDKFMIQLTSLLKDKRYEQALPVFDKLEALGLPLDPSFNYFRGDAFLKSGQKPQALNYLYTYIRNQGSQATYYRQALELINQAEAQ